MAGHTSPDFVIKTEMKALIDAKSLGPDTIIDFIEDDTVSDYFVIRLVSDVPMTNKQSWGNDQIYAIDIFSKSSLASVVDGYKSAIQEALTESIWTLTGFNWLITIPDGSTNVPDPDHEVLHKVLFIRVKSTGNERVF